SPARPCRRCACRTRRTSGPLESTPPPESPRSSPAQQETQDSAPLGCHHVNGTGGREGVNCEAAPEGRTRGVDSLSPRLMAPPLSSNFHVRGACDRGRPKAVAK